MGLISYISLLLPVASLWPEGLSTGNPPAKSPPAGGAIALLPFPVPPFFLPSVQKSNIKNTIKYSYPNDLIFNVPKQTILLSSRFILFPQAP